MTPSGELIVAGWVDYDTPFVARFDSDGRLDPGFSEDGYVFLDPEPSPPSGTAAAVTPAGEVVVLVSSQRVQRLTPTGEVDRSFGVDGLATPSAPLLQPGNSVDKLALDSAGRIVFAGTRNRDLAVTRLTTDGHPDTSFDGDGLAVASPVPASSVQTPRALQWGELVAVRPDNRVLVVGEAVTDSGEAEFVAAQFNTDGTLDASFNGDGMTHIPAPAPGGSEADPKFFSPRAISLEETGSAVVRLAIQYAVPPLYGRCPGGSTLRLDDDGAIDSGFGDGGFARIDSSACPRDFALLDTAGLFAVGVHADRGVPWYVSQTLYTSDGQFDSAFVPQPRRSRVAGLNSDPASIARLPSGVLITVGSALIPRCVTPEALQCSLGFLLAQQPNGEVVSSFGSHGVSTLPRTRICPDPFARCPYPYRGEFARLARRGVARNTTLVEGVLRTRLKCLAEVEETCEVRAWFSPPRSNEILAKVRRTSIRDGRAVRSRSGRLSREEIARVTDLSHVEIHAVFDGAHQEPVRFSRRVRLKQA